MFFCLTSNQQETLTFLLPLATRPEISEDEEDDPQNRGQDHRRVEGIHHRYYLNLKK